MSLPPPAQWSFSEIDNKGRYWSETEPSEIKSCNIKYEISETQARDIQRKYNHNLGSFN